jgi:hypothetical protein
MANTWDELTSHWATPGYFTTLCEKDLLADKLRFKVGESLQTTNCTGCQIALIRLYADVCPELKPPKAAGKWELLLRLMAEGKLDDVDDVA